MRYVGAQVPVRQTSTGYEILHYETVIARHARLERHHVAMDPAHYAGLLRLPGNSPPPTSPRWDPSYPASGDVAVRDLSAYAALAEELVSAGGATSMSLPQLERLAEHCPRLRLYRVEAELANLLEQAAKRELSYSDFLDEVLDLKPRSKHKKHLAMRVSMARFPFQKSLESFDWKFQPSIDPKVIKELATGRYLAHGENVLLLGPPGVGKTHLAVALGLKAREQGLRTMFTKGESYRLKEKRRAGLLKTAPQPERSLTP